MKSCCKLCGEENCGFVSRKLEYKCDKYNLYCATVDKACEWLKENKDHPFIGCEDPCLSGYLTDEFIETFIKAMEE